MQPGAVVFYTAPPAPAAAPPAPTAAPPAPATLDQDQVPAVPEGCYPLPPYALYTEPLGKIDLDLSMV